MWNRRKLLFTECQIINVEEMVELEDYNLETTAVKTWSTKNTNGY